MRTGALILAAVAVVIVATYLFLVPKPGSKTVLESGDIIFRKENSFWGDIASSAARKDGKYSHAGVILVEKGQIYVIHAYADTNKKQAKVSKQPLDEFLSNATAWGYYRLNFPPLIRHEVAYKALAYYNAKTPFDEEFSLADDKAVYCTELVWRSIKNASGIDAAPTKSTIMHHQFIGNDDLFMGGFMKELK
jgi:hypothetical protein